MPERVYLGKSTYELKAKNGRCIRLCHRTATREEVFAAYAKIVGSDRLKEDEQQAAKQDHTLLDKNAILAISQSAEKIIGVYFLIKNKEIVYVGQSRDIMSRLAAHLGDDSKIFDSYAILPTTFTMLSVLESKYIKKFQPIHNKVHVTKRGQKTRSIATIPDTNSRNKVAGARDHVLRDPQGIEFMRETLGWTMGIEPTTTGATILCSTN